MNPFGNKMTSYYAETQARIVNFVVPPMRTITDGK